MNSAGDPYQTDVSIPLLSGKGTWEQVIEENHADLKNLLFPYLRKRRWFGGKARNFDSVKITRRFRLNFGGKTAYILLIQTAYVDGPAETYVLPLTFDSGDQAAAIRKHTPSVILADAELKGSEKGLLYDALWDETFTKGLLQTILAGRRLHSERGVLEASTTRYAGGLPSPKEMPPRISQAEQSNTSVLFGDRLILKLFRRLETGVNPDLEIGRFLTQKTGFSHIPGLVGALEYRESGREPSTLAVIHRFIENQGDAWQHTLGYLNRYYERVVSNRKPPETPMNLLASIHEEAPPEVRKLFGDYLSQAALLGLRTGELHSALGSETNDPAFAPEPFTGVFKQSEYRSMQNLLTRVFRDARNRLAVVPDHLRSLLGRVLDLESGIVHRFQSMRDRSLDSMRIRTHGDYHLGQVLYTGRDFVVIDFEGEPARSLDERKRKQSPFRDVAGMIRSFHYAGYASMFEQKQGPEISNLTDPAPWRDLWYKWTGIYFLRSYLETCRNAPFMPKAVKDMETLLNAYLLEKGVYELGYELNNRPEWIRIPMEGILELMGESVSSEQ